MKKTFSILLALALVLSFTLVTTAPVAAQTTYYVATTGNDTSGDGTQGSPWATINYAISQVSAGDTIIVNDGTYSYATETSPGAGMIVIDKGLTLKAADSVRPVLDGSGDDGVIKIWPAALEDGSPVIIEGFEITGNAATDIAITGRMYTTATDDLIIRDNIIHGMNAGIDFWGSSGGKLKNIEITGNEFYDLGQNDKYYGIMLEGLANWDTAGEAYAALVEGNDFHDIGDGTNPGTGIVIPGCGTDEAANARIASNSFANVNTGIAILTCDASEALIVDNEFGDGVTTPVFKGTGAVSMTAASEPAVIGISVEPGSIDFGAVTSGASVSGSALTVTNTGNVQITVDADITADTFFDVANTLYFYTAALRLQGGPSDQVTNPTTFGSWVHSQLFGPDPIEVTGSRSLTTGLQCPPEIKAATTYTGTVVFWAEQP